MNKTSLIKNIVYFVLVFLIISSIFSLYNFKGTEFTDINIQKMIQDIEQEQVTKINVKGDTIELELKDGTFEKLKKESTESFSAMLNNLNVDPAKIKEVQIEIQQESGTAYWLGLILPFLIPFLLVVVFLWFMMKQVQGANSKAMSFGQSKARQLDQKGLKKITFKDVAGVQEAKEELEEIVEFLKNPKKFTSLGAKIPKGVLLMGRPGTGKTLLAKAVAGEAGVPFFTISGSEFVEMFVGVGASRVRDLFKNAKKSAPCIVFIDEIDAVGRQRGSGVGGSHDEREQTLNQILVEMDGFDPHTNVIVVAATNRPDVLDPALLRPGRFDRRVVIDLPDIKDRIAILKVHARQKPIDKEVDLKMVAERTPGFSGADLENLLNEAAIFTARQNKKIIGQKEVFDSIEKVLLGPERKSHILSNSEKEITAVHEAGHALVSHMLPKADPVHKVSIISRGHAAGYTMNLPSEDKHLHTKSEFVAELAVLLAGHTAETMKFGEPTTGASNDLQRATEIARNLITQFGMSSHLVPRIYGDKEEMIFLGRDIKEQRNYSEKIAESIDDEIDKLISSAIDTCKQVITDNKDKMDRLVKELLDKETVEKVAFEAIMAGKEVKEAKKEEIKTEDK